MAHPLLPIIARRPGFLGGAYYVRGTAVTVAEIKQLKRGGVAVVMRRYPGLTPSQITAALRFRSTEYRGADGHE